VPDIFQTDRLSKLLHQGVGSRSGQVTPSKSSNSHFGIRRLKSQQPPREVDLRRLKTEPTKVLKPKGSWQRCAGMSLWP
jgi:hypothetical protein